MKINFLTSGFPNGFRQEFVNEIRNHLTNNEADVVWISVGNTLLQIENIKNYGLIEALQKKWNNNRYESRCFNI